MLCVVDSIMMRVALFFVILGQPWLASTRSSRRGRPETSTGDLLLPRAAPLLLPCATRWEASAAITPLLLPHVCRRWEAPAFAASLLLPPPTRMTWWRCGWRLLLLLYTYRWLLLLPPTCLAPPPMTPTHVWECPHIKEVSSYEHCF
jgi:hypothetical protein